LALDHHLRGIDRADIVVAKADVVHDLKLIKSI
jgi:hypothetical protein